MVPPPRSHRLTAFDVGGCCTGSNIYDAFEMMLYLDIYCISTYIYIWYIDIYIYGIYIYMVYLCVYIYIYRYKDTYISIDTYIYIYIDISGIFWYWIMKLSDVKWCFFSQLKTWKQAKWPVEVTMGWIVSEYFLVMNATILNPSMGRRFF